VRLLIVGSRCVLQREADTLGLNVLPPSAPPHGPFAEPVSLLDLDNFPADGVEPRAPDAAAGRASIDYIQRAVQLVRAGTADALVTCPISKEAISAAGSPFPGHTEMLADLAGGATPLMLMMAPGLRVALVTTHMALRDVPDAVTSDGIVEIAQILAAGLRRYFAAPKPRIAVCGLNPHCSDGGRFGDEEERVIAPAVQRLRDMGLDVHGPKPSDTVFGQVLDGQYDAVLALYHDQALIPVKLAGLQKVVNVTLGLPFIRTSVGHGTAYDIAGQGVADESSLREAIAVAAQMASAVRPGRG